MSLRPVFRPKHTLFFAFSGVRLADREPMIAARSSCRSFGHVTCRRKDNLRHIHWSGPVERMAIATIVKRLRFLHLVFEENSSKIEIKTKRPRLIMRHDCVRTDCPILPGLDIKIFLASPQRLSPSIVPIAMASPLRGNATGENARLTEDVDGDHTGHCCLPPAVECTKRAVKVIAVIHQKACGKPTPRLWNDGRRRNSPQARFQPFIQ